MAEKITFLGIETSCDETAAAVIRENDKGTADILSNIVSSQIEEHKKFGKPFMMCSLNSLGVG